MLMDIKIFGHSEIQITNSNLHGTGQIQINTEICVELDIQSKLVLRQQHRKQGQTYKRSFALE